MVIKNVALLIFVTLSLFACASSLENDADNSLGLSDSQQNSNKAASAPYVNHSQNNSSTQPSSAGSGDVIVINPVDSTGAR